ncbi:MAG: serine/threonine-protein kinase [Verrucomicrobiota bacterium]
MSSASSTCPSCGTVLSKNAPRGLCAKCLLVVGLDSPTEKETSVAGQVPENLNQNPPIPFSRLRYFGDYELIEEIGRGGMGLVFKARQVSLNRLVAVKLISSGTLATEVLVKRFKAEAETAASLSHPNIVPIYEIGEHDGQHYFSMGLIEGPTLRELLLARRRWSSQRKSPHAHDHSSAPTASDEVLNGEIEPREAVRLMIIIARAVHYAHQRGVLHRDIKPGNILLDSARQPHLTDFGLAKLIEKESTITHTHAVLGTPAYMAPEQARGDTKNVTTAVDVYGLGAVLYETLTGSPPFAGGTSMETIRQVLELEPRRPSHLNPRIDRDLETICLKCLEKLPEHRYASADALVDDLERWCAAEPIEARRAGTGERLIKWTRRKPVVAALTGSLALVAVIGLLAVVWQWRRAEAARREAIQRAADEQKARTRLAETISELEIQKAQEQLAQGQGSMALARLARVLRDSPTNQLAASRIVAALSDRNFVWPLTDPIRLTNRVTSQRLSLDGRFVMTQTWDTVEVWNALTGKAAGPPLRFEGPIIWADISSDGERVAIYARDKVLDPRIWEVRSGAILATLKVFTDEQRQLVSRMGFGVSGMELSPDGLWLLTVSRVNSSSAATIWDARTGAQLFSHNQDCTFAKFSRDGRKVLLFTYEGISRWNPLTGEQEKIAPASMRSMELSPDEQWAFSKEGFFVHIREAATGRSLPELLVHNGLINSIRFSPDHQRVVTVSSDWTGRIWDFQSGLGLGQPLQHAGAVQHGTFSPDGRLVATASHDKTARIWDAHTGIPLVEPIRHDRPVVFVDFSPDGQRLLTVTTNTIRLWHVGVDAFQAWASSAIRSQRTI